MNADSLTKPEPQHQQREGLHQQQSRDRGARTQHLCQLPLQHHTEDEGYGTVEISLRSSSIRRSVPEHAANPVPTVELNAKASDPH